MSILATVSLFWMFLAVKILFLADVGSSPEVSISRVFFCVRRRAVPSVASAFKIPPTLLRFLAPNWIPSNAWLFHWKNLSVPHASCFSCPSPRGFSRFYMSNHSFPEIILKPFPCAVLLPAVSCEFLYLSSMISAAILLTWLGTLSVYPVSFFAITYRRSFLFPSSGDSLN